MMPPGATAPHSYSPGWKGIFALAARRCLESTDIQAPKPLNSLQGRKKHGGGSNHLFSYSTQCNDCNGKCEMGGANENHRARSPPEASCFKIAVASVAVTCRKRDVQLDCIPRYIPHQKEDSNQQAALASSRHTASPHLASLCGIASRGRTADPGTRRYSGSAATRGSIAAAPP